MATDFRSHVLSSPKPTSISSFNSNNNHSSHTLLHFPRISNPTFPSHSSLSSSPSIITNPKLSSPKSTVISCSQSQNNTPSHRRPQYIPSHIPDPNYVRIFDTTLRNGERSPGASMTSKEKTDIARQLAKLGVDVIEAGFPAASKDDFEAVKMIAKEVGNAADDEGYVPVICGLSRCNEIMAPQDIGLERSNEAGIVLGKLSGCHALKKKLEELGYELNDDQHENIFWRFKAAAEQKKFRAFISCFSPAMYRSHAPLRVSQRMSIGRTLEFRRHRSSASLTRAFAISNMGSSTSEHSNTIGDPEDDSDVLIECKEVYKSFGEKEILNGVSFKIRHGEAVGIIGPSGTGKSTVLKIIAGLLSPDKGEVYIRGQKRAGLISDEEISGLRIGLVFQSAALFDSLTVRENVGFLLYEHSRMSEDQISELVKESLAAVGLKDVEDRLPSELSGGMKKRVALARSIIYDTTNDSIEPEVLLYDEPTAGLDPIASTVVEDLIRSVHIKGRDALGKPGKIASYVVVTHQHSTIKRAIDRLLFLHKGKIVWEGMTHEFTTSTNPIVQQFASGSLDGPIKY